MPYSWAWAYTLAMWNPFSWICWIQKVESFPQSYHCEYFRYCSKGLWTRLGPMWEIAGDWPKPVIGHKNDVTKQRHSVKSSRLVPCFYPIKQCPPIQPLQYKPMAVSVLLNMFHGRNALFSMKLWTKSLIILQRITCEMKNDNGSKENLN